VAASLKYSDFIDLALAWVAQADRRDPGSHVDLFQLASELKEPIPDQWVFDAAERLDLQGLVKWMRVFGRTAMVVLTGEGRLYVEQGGATGVIHEYQRQPSQFFVITGEGHNVAISQTGDVVQDARRQEQGDVFVLISQIENGLEADDTLTDEQRAGFRTDLEAVRGQLEKPEPNRSVIKALLEPIGSLASVGSLVVKLIELVT
jgi:hypothetical protein